MNIYFILSKNINFYMQLQNTKENYNSDPFHIIFLFLYRQLRKQHCFGQEN